MKRLYLIAWEIWKISNLATTVFCYINEMFHFQRDCQDILKTVPSLLCTPSPHPQNKVLCFVFSKRTMKLFLTHFQQVLKCLFYSSFFVSWSCSEDSFLWFTNSPSIASFMGRSNRTGPFGNRVRIEPKIFHTCKLLSVLWVELGGQVSEYLQQNSLPLLK